VDWINRELQHISLPTAAALICFGATGITLDASRPEEMQRLLNNLAHAISNVAAIFALDAATGKPTEIPGAELLGATFLRGAHVLLTTGGKEYRGLTVQRRDMNSAIVILKRAGFGIR
jgi:hypothetical protein